MCHQDGRITPLCHAKRCFITCGYVFPEWCCDASEATWRGKEKLRENDFACDEPGPHNRLDLIVDPATGKWHYLGWEIEL